MEHRHEVTRHLLNLLTALSLLLCVAVCVLWVRSYTRAEHFWLNHGDGSRELLRSDQGVLTLERRKDPEQASGGLRFEYAAGPLVGSYPRAYSKVSSVGSLHFAATAPPQPKRNQRRLPSLRLRPARHAGQVPRVRQRRYAADWLPFDVASPDSSAPGVNPTAACIRACFWSS